jgi:hypothetical protein
LSIRFFSFYTTTTSKMSMAFTGTSSLKAGNWTSGCGNNDGGGTGGRLSRRSLGLGFVFVLVINFHDILGMTE